MKLSVSLERTDVEFLDEYARLRGYRSRSAVLQQAVRLLRASELGSEYSSAWAEWGESTEAEAWEATAGDGIALPG
jgi:Arc/MetJ-type ribon-helix-helix transcriptional regulator